METPSPFQSPFYTLVIDEKRSGILNMLFGCAMLSGGTQFLYELGRHGLLEEYYKFREEDSKKEHEKGWCKDKNCKLKQNDNEKDN